MCPCDGSSQLDGDGIDSSASQCYAGLEWQQSGHEARRQKEANNAVDEKKPAQAKKLDMKNKKSVVMKKPSGKAMVKMDAVVVKKPAKSAFS